MNNNSHQYETLEDNIFRIDVGNINWEQSPDAQKQFFSVIREVIDKELSFWEKLKDVCGVRDVSFLDLLIPAYSNPKIKKAIILDYEKKSVPTGPNEISALVAAYENSYLYSFELMICNVPETFAAALPHTEELSGPACYTDLTIAQLAARRMIQKKNGLFHNSSSLYETIDDHIYRIDAATIAWNNQAASISTLNTIMKAIINEGLPLSTRLAAKLRRGTSTKVDYQTPAHWQEHIDKTIIIDFQNQPIILSTDQLQSIVSAYTLAYDHNAALTFCNVAPLTMQQLKDQKHIQSQQTINFLSYTNLPEAVAYAREIAQRS